MKLHGLLTFLLVCVPAFAEHTSKIISYNIRQDTVGDTGPRDWSLRKGMLINFLSESNASVIGLQEVRYNQLCDIDHDLEDFSYVGVGREDGKKKGEYAPIFYDRRIWQVDPKENGTFWLSDTPKLANSKTWGNNYTRICTWARMIKIKEPGKGVYFYNTHWDHQSQPARLKSGQLMLQMIKNRSYQKDRFILMGDLNATIKNPAVNQLLRSGLLNNSIKDNFLTGNKWNTKLVDGLAIDHIFTSIPFTVISSRIVVNAGIGGNAASDHHPVVLSVALP